MKENHEINIKYFN